MIIAPGSDWDVHGCIASAGYTWCRVLGKCLRIWTDVCEIPDNCLIWSDGCNMCAVVDGQMTSCSQMNCMVMAEPFCQVRSRFLDL